MKYFVIVSLFLSGCSAAPTVKDMMFGAYVQGRLGEQFDPSKVKGYDEYYGPQRNSRNREYGDSRSKP